MTYESTIMRDDDPLKYFPGYAEACAKAEANNLAPEAARPDAEFASTDWVAADSDTQWQCPICGRTGSVGRCCGDETRIPLNEAARKDAARTKAATDQGEAQPPAKNL